MTETRILVVDDEIHLAEGIGENLVAEGYCVDYAGDGVRALECMRSTRYDLVLLDVMMPGLDGFTVCEKARSEGVDSPVLFLTARSGVDDRVHGLKTGGDDYLAKPFHLRELLARVEALLRRGRGPVTPATTRAEFGGNEIDFDSYTGRSWDGRAQTLTQKEAMILKVLVEHEGKVVSRDRILDDVWGFELFPSSRTVDNFLLRLRRRFERDPEQPSHFHTVRGVGYRFTSNPEEPS